MIRKYCHKILIWHNQVSLSITARAGKDERHWPAGGRTLLLIAVPRHVGLLTDLASGPRSLAELRHEAGSPPETTMRGYLRSLAAAKAVEKRRHGGFPGTVDYRLTAAGDDLIGVAETLASWLATSPQRPAALGTSDARRATKALVEGWASGIVRILASHPRSLTELDGAIYGLSYPALERRLALMRRFGLVQAVPASGRSTRFEVSDWLRTSAAPLDAGTRWERRWLVDSGNNPDDLKGRPGH